MDLSTFIQKLEKLNSDLYVDLNHRTYSTNKELGSSGIYIKKRSENIEYHNDLSLEQKNIVKQYNESPHTYVSWVTHSWVPEGDVFDEKGKPIAQGWRTIVKNLVDHGYASKRKAEKEFGWFESTYDRMDYNSKLDKYRRENGNTHNRILS